MNLVTGGTGLLGSHLLFDLINKGEKTRAIKTKNSDIKRVEKLFKHYAPEKNIFNQIEWFDADILDVFSLEDAMQDIDKIYHCAAKVSFVPTDADMMYKINGEGTANLVNIALEKKIKKFCHVSSIATLGRQLDVSLIDENCWWKDSPQNSNYSKSKYAAEMEVWRAAEEGLNTIIVNPSIIIGPGDWKKGSSKMFLTSYHGLKYYSDGCSGFVDVRDVAAIMIKLMESDVNQERFIINGENASYRSFFDKIHDQFGKKKPHVKAGKFLTELAWRMDTLKSFLTSTSPLLTKESARSAHHQYAFSNLKIKSLLNFEFRKIDQMIEDTCMAFKKENVL